MKYIFLNLKRFDIPKELGGVNSIAPISQWGGYISEKLDKGLGVYKNEDVEFAGFFPEAHIIPAVSALSENIFKIGCQSVINADTAVGGNFGAFTTGRTGNAMKALGCDYTIIGHCEERNSLLSVLNLAGSSDKKLVHKRLNEQIKAAQKAGLKVLYCIGETMEEQDQWETVLKDQIEIGLDGVDMSGIVLAYEPVWSIGPGKTPPNREYIEKIGKFVKNLLPETGLVYGGGLKQDNAEMLASIPEIDGGLIALTRFSGDIGFYPEEYFEIVKLYLGTNND